LKYSIAPIEERHIEGFHQALDFVAREKKYLAFLEAPPLQRTRQFVLANINDGNPQFVVLADERIVGWCDVIRNSGQSRQHSGVLGVALLPEYRGNGIGRELLKRTINAAWSQGFTRIELTVREINANAIALYKSLGFANEGIRRNASRVDGKYENLVSMALLNGNAV
jgi:ribosomal protein S18 acetylase RimI-like enzyme